MTQRELKKRRHPGGRRRFTSVKPKGRQTDPEALEQKVQTPWGHLAVDRFVGIVTVDPLIHTFDLAVATRQEVVIDRGLAKAGYMQLQKAGDMIRGERFGPEIQLDGDESTVEKLVAMAGRNPQLGSYISSEAQA